MLESIFTKVADLHVGKEEKLKLRLRVDHQEQITVPSR